MESCWSSNKNSEKSWAYLYVGYLLHNDESLKVARKSAYPIDPSQVREQGQMKRLRRRVWDQTQSLKEWETISLFLFWRGVELSGDEKWKS